MKGIMCEEDALNALKNGADSIWISNGSHQKSSTAPSTIRVLQNISK